MTGDGLKDKHSGGSVQGGAVSWDFFNFWVKVS